MRSSRRLAVVACWQARPSSSRPATGRPRLCRRTETAAPLVGRCARAGERSTPGSFLRGRRGGSRCCPRCASAPGLVDESIVVTLEDAARAMRAVADRVHVIAEGAAACAVAAALSKTLAAHGHKKVVAVVSGGNIDLAQFAALTRAE